MLLKGQTAGSDVNFAEIKTHVTSAQILNIVGNPILLAPAPGVGKAIRGVNIVVSYTFNTAPYATSTTLTVRYVNSTVMGTTAIISQGASIIKDIGIASDGTIPANTGIELFKAATDPTAGSGTLDFYVTYEIITL